jgi:hypothetical protein
MPHGVRDARALERAANGPDPCRAPQFYNRVYNGNAKRQKRERM